VVGADGTPAASAALRWAVGHTDLYGPIRPVLAWQYPVFVWLPQPVGSGVPPAETMQVAAEIATQACVEQIDPDQIVDPIIVEGDAGPVLVEAATHASLLVVGARGLGPVRGWLLGSVGRYCTDHTTIPLVIVPDRDEASNRDAHAPRRIAVGIDGSARSEDALRWAIRHSRPEDTITAHTVWNFLGRLGYETYTIEAPVLENAAIDTVSQTVTRITTELGVEPGRVLRTVDCGDPRTVLRSIGENADLLVVGSRGHSGLPHFFVGSTATSLIHNPVCPTVIVPHPAVVE
jgi:nucleotide-binding universal stress UspA family protein